MSEQDGLNPAERELEEALKSLAPAAARIDPIGAAYESGRRSGRRQVQLWRAATAAALFVGLGSWFIPIGQKFTTNVPVIVQQPPSFTQPLAAQSVLMLQAAFRERGLAGLPETEPPPVEITRSGDWL